MWLQAIFTPADLERVLGEITPLAIALDDQAHDRYLWLERPSQVETPASKGLRIVTSARLQWNVMGIPVPILLRSVTLLLTPSIARRDGKDMLAFEARIEHADLTGVPEFVENGLLERMNEELAKERAQLVWHFMDTLDFHFNLPDAMQPARQMHLFARWGALRMTEEGVAVAASFSLNAESPQAARDTARQH
jgi:hypothetical protein